MTLDEKLGQLVQRAGGRSKALNSRLDDAELERVRAGQVGSYLHVAGAEPLARLQKVAVEESRLGIPLLFAMDVVHGYRTIFPVPLAMAATWAPESRGARRARRGRRSHLGGPALDLRAHDRHRARSALGTHRRRRGRRSLPRRAHGRGPGERLPGRQRAAPGLADGHRQAFRRVWRRHRRPRLQQRRRLRAHAAGSLSTAVLRRGARRLRFLHGGVQRHRRRAHHRQPRAAARHCCANAGAGRGSWSATGARSASSSITAWRQTARPPACWRSMPVGRHGHGGRRVRRRPEGRDREGSGAPQTTRRGGAAHPARQGAARAVRQADAVPRHRTRGARAAGARSPRSGARHRAPVHRAAQERGQAAAADAGEAAQHRRDRRAGHRRPVGARFVACAGQGRRSGHHAQGHHGRACRTR